MRKFNNMAARANYAFWLAEISNLFSETTYDGNFTLYVCSLHVDFVFMIKFPLHIIQIYVFTVFVVMFLGLVWIMVFNATFNNISRANYAFWLAEISNLFSETTYDGNFTLYVCSLHVPV
jgi:maltodextrin utilization protein YvdJ